MRNAAAPDTPKRRRPPKYRPAAKAAIAQAGQKSAINRSRRRGDGGDDGAVRPERRATRSDQTCPIGHACSAPANNHQRAKPANLPVSIPWPARVHRIPTPQKAAHRQALKRHRCSAGHGRGVPQTFSRDSRGLYRQSPADSAGFASRISATINAEWRQQQNKLKPIGLSSHSNCWASASAPRFDRHIHGKTLAQRRSGGA